MIIEMKITIEIMKKNPLDEVEPETDQPVQEERTQSTLDRFKTVKERMFREVKQPRKGSSRMGVMTYREGRTIHCCTNCGTPHRRMNKETGVCKDELCGIGFGDLEASA